VDSLKALDLNRPTREADIRAYTPRNSLESVSERRAPYKISYSTDRYSMIPHFFTLRFFWL